MQRSGQEMELNGQRVGFLFSQERLKAEWTDTERPGGTDIAFAADGSINLVHWLGTDDPEVLSRVCVFAQTGTEGSMAAFWLDDDGQQRIVHLGSGSGSTLVCVLADDPVDFIRLLATGWWRTARACSPRAPPAAASAAEQPGEHRGYPHRCG